MAKMNPCDICRHFIKFTACLKSPFKFQTPWLVWKQETKDLFISKQDCPLCAALWELPIENSLNKARERFVGVTTESSHPISLKVLEVNNTGRILWASLEVSLEIERDNFVYLSRVSMGISPQDVNDPNPHPHFWTSGRTHPFQTLAEDRVLCVKTWLNTCESTHGSYCQPRKGKLPKRFIDTRPGQPLRLVSTTSEVFQQVSDSVRYATLSYCWGASIPLRTTKVTEEDFGVSIPENRLPRTFRHAIRIVRSLGIRYLWIDSLCIIQDDQAEWELEASRMGDFYAGSIITIAASYALDSEGGCFPGDDDSMEAVVNDKDSGQLETANPERTSGAETDPTVRIFAYKEEDLNDSSQPFSSTMIRFQSLDPRKIPQHAHLSTRGWALQERILSRRIIQCLNSEVHWQCQYWYQTQAVQTFEVPHSTASDSTYPISQISQWWPGWIEDYSQRDFTIASDRLQAFAGISNHYADLASSKPILGVCPGNLARDLAWIRDGLQKGPGVPGAPSWTWFSCNAPIMMDDWGFNLNRRFKVSNDVNLVSFGIEWKGIPMTSQIQSCHLIICGVIKELAVRIPPEAMIYNPPYMLIEDEETDFSKGPIPWTCSGRFDDPKHPTDSRSPYTCLLLRTRTVNEGQDGTFIIETFLILSSENGPLVRSIEHKRFRRIGIASFRGKEKIFPDNIERKTVFLM
ncbi:heterokaryon incompatibility protein-domain-containing protein [Colletotrichum godetiae]|uniref:Heterokaryon incompatibility protein-domain-containing protein n=1 Tax=Colletotrichum godetiae TaxID=1209918 RepID=A0AAJ0AWT6_9PEZI|nr:heterokaryon incompatibility protein-domain-containing protein [Colletotrichum godetiae]KAK1689584.1 heterokaryon incompatibility protein-domain-containing protein [Colletotrichum godetiae]